MTDKINTSLNTMATEAPATATEASATATKAPATATEATVTATKAKNKVKKNIGVEIVTDKTEVL